LKAELVYWNPGASKPLRVSMDVICNTPDERIIANIRHNSSRQTGWQKLESPHAGVAVLCGSGPSLKETEIPKGHIFALNGACGYLNQQGITPDFQVLLDAKPETASLIAEAKQYLFASQVDSVCFEKKNAKLWQATHGDLALDFPEYKEDYCMIGGAVTVGNSALVLAYVMGYREIHCVGFDSSHKEGRGHAFHQKMNDGDPTTLVEFGGKDYVCSMTMRLQAQHFLARKKMLEEAGCKIVVHGYGLLPDMVNNPWSEKDKYRQMWTFDNYREVSPGESVASTFVDLSGIDAGQSVIDFGCGTGRGGKRIRDLTGASVMLVDFAENCLDQNIDLPFRLHDLTQPLNLHSEYGFCTDVLEHIPTDDVPKVLDTLFGSCMNVFLQISLVDDVMGALINEPLHLTVKPYGWWVETLKKYGRIQWSENRGHAALFYLTT
jgi:hypothetical protein